MIICLVMPALTLVIRIVRSVTTHGVPRLTFPICVVTIQLFHTCEFTALSL